MLTGTLVVLALLIALLLIPVTLEFRLDWPERRNREFRIIWAFGLIRAPATGRRAPEPPDDVPVTRASKRSAGGLTRAFRYRPFRRRVYRFLGQAWQSVRKQDVFVEARLGLDDPADTGRLWALAGPVAGLLATIRGIRLRLTPDFQSEVVDIDAGGRMTIIPLQLLGLLLALAVSPDLWRGLRLARTGRR